ncbi:hypothetical protein CVT24_011972 [Panaeolus cyanescens]|uniref:Uncharacterized protein n=1 Tax=Panaeolus cyanescens TaxID=181874 RepID=A0A409X2Y4_9AGAR|nr:hypothetical protein CVT24_011972 [Panaeolus cyanescens]
MQTFDWTRADEMYERGVIVNSIGDVGEGVVVGWKTLAINPDTFTPEMMLSAAKVLQLVVGEGEDGAISTSPSTSPSTSTQIKFKLLPKPKPTESTLDHYQRRGRGLAIAAIHYDEDEEMGDAQQEEEEEVVTMRDVEEMGWRVLCRS